MHFIEKNTVSDVRRWAPSLTFCQRRFQIESCLYGEGRSYPAVVWKPPLKIFIALSI